MDAHCPRPGARNACPDCRRAVAGGVVNEYPAQEVFSIRGLLWLDALPETLGRRNDSQ
jgi:hypothetical protein